jgi:hypothetical protein
LQAQGTWSASEGDDKQRFLADLRALRDGAALEFYELAARAHYPSDVLKEAENGPSLPSLPILAAYVRACDGDVPEWEERWRRLSFASGADDGLPVRPAGASPAAVAGARAGVSVVPPDAYDPDRIRAALRGSHGRSDQGVRGAAAWAVTERDTPVPAVAEPRLPESPANWSAATSWDETTRWDVDRSPETAPGWGADAAGWGSAVQRDSGVERDAGERWDGVTADLRSAGTPSNGNRYASQPGDMPSDAAATETPDVTQADAIRRDPFSTDWLQDGELASPPDIEGGWPEQAEAEPPAPAEESWFTPHETADREQAWPAADTEPPPATADGWFTPRERADGGLAPPQPAERDIAPPQPVERDVAVPQPVERDVAPPQEPAAEPIVTGFWTPSAAPSVPAASVPAEAQRPAPPPTDDYAVPRASWTPAAGIPTSEIPAAEIPAAEIPAAEIPAAEIQAGEIQAGDPPGVADQATSVLAQAAAAASSRTIAGSAVPPGPVVPPRRPRSDRLNPVRLLVVVVVAALIGSILVLILR